MRLTWLAGDPDAVAGSLEAIGFVRAGEGRLALPTGFEMTVVREDAVRDERLVADAPPSPARGAPGAAAAPPAVAWATVDAERLAREWSARLVPLPDDGPLGAFAWLVRDVVPATVLLEPSTEAPITAALARHGEGPIALYVTAPTTALATATQRSGETPFGPGRLLGSGRWGPYLVLLPGRGGRVPSPR